MLKILKVPHGFTEAPYEQSVLKMNGFSVVESCLHTQRTTGTMFLEDHMLLFVLKGQYKICFGEKTYKVNENEMVLLHKSIVIKYEKTGKEESEYLLDYIMFFLKDDLLTEFIKMYDFNHSFPSIVVPLTVNPINKRLKGYIESLKPLFNDSSSISNGLVKLKLLELLYDLVDTNEKLLFQFLLLKQKERRSILDVVEENLYNPVNVNDLAYLSGRSLSTFKREFKEIYNTSPLKWIRNRRLDKARELFLHTEFSVTEVCFSTGFENVAHFSKVFKERFGVSPSMFKQSTNLH
ncbi:AraC family transcriptional regulator [Bacillus sp. SA1-12]|uniref:AraC family transcriptional regulator n=1 Tax=Bacillus sp. SA1-12 TaxID=1455638 RepID=UPI0006272BE7|nr:AraC family transcriptional regulator [Bacillus sp. SA1-12]KKI91175.1 AraC family transcriptional regulator [Bacillus sp. SA1-12]